MPDFSLPESFETFDWFVLGLRIVFIFLVYFFLYQVARVSIRELVTIGRVTSAEQALSQAAMPNPAAVLQLLDPAESSWPPGYRFPLDHYTTIGRSDDNSVVLDDSFVSGTHAELTFENGAWWLQDLNSTNGTLSNGQPVHSRVRIDDGDIVQFGRVQLRALL